MHGQLRQTSAFAGPTHKLTTNNADNCIILNRLSCVCGDTSYIKAKLDDSEYDGEVCWWHSLCRYGGANKKANR